MAQPGSYRIQSRTRGIDDPLEPDPRGARRARRILDSLRHEIAGGEGTVRVRRVFERPREIYRVEIESPEFAYLRTTLLDRASLEELLRAEGVRDRVRVAGG
jgi:hypothetical protein